MFIFEQLLEMHLLFIPCQASLISPEKNKPPSSIDEIINKRNHFVDYNDDGRGTLLFGVKIVQWFDISQVKNRETFINI